MMKGVLVINLISEETIAAMIKVNLEVKVKIIINQLLYLIGRKKRRI